MKFHEISKFSTDRQKRKTNSARRSRSFDATSHFESVAEDVLDMQLLVDDQTSKFLITKGGGSGYAARRILSKILAQVGPFSALSAPIFTSGDSFRSIF
jgi:GDP dissociation inhibitor.